MLNSKHTRSAACAAMLALALLTGLAARPTWAQTTPLSSADGQANAQANGQVDASAPQAPASPNANLQAPDAAGQMGMGAADAAPSIRIGAGDLLNIVVFETPELSASVRVNQNGEANIPVLGSVQLAGLSATEAARTLEDQFRSKGLLVDPHVSVFVSEYASQGASVLGEVRSPGVYPTLGSRRLMDMLSLAGGVAPTAGKVASIVHKGDPTHPVQIAIQPTPASLHAQVNPIIQPGDTIVVAKAGVVYVIGDILRPGGILVDNNERISVIEALSLSGGMNKTAALSKTKLIRKLPAGREEIDLDLKHILYGKQADVMISDGDILFVPSSVGKTFLYRGIEAAIALSTSYALFVH